MITRRARMLLVVGFLHGALLYGAAVSLLQVVHNRLAAPRDAALVLAYCGVLYGGLGAATALVAGLAAASTTARGATEDAVSRRALAGGLAVFAAAYWFFFFNYGLTYDEYPFGALTSSSGMLAYLAARTVLIVAAAGAGGWVAASWWLARPSRTRGRDAALLAAALVCTHLALPLYLRGAGGQPARPAIPAPAAPARRDDAEALKVILIGIDGADWRVIRPLVDAGRLPTFADLMRQGSCGPLATLPDANSAMIWATIYTGKSVARHGIEDFYRIRLAGMGSQGLFPVHRTAFKELVGPLETLGLARRLTMYRGSLRAIPLWEVLDRSGVSVGIVNGYYYSYPAFAPLDPASYVLAYGLDGAYQRLVRLGREPDGEALHDYVRPREVLAEVAPELDRDELRWQAGATLRLLEHRPQPRLLSVYTRQPDNDQHRYWRWYQPQLFVHVDRAQAARYGDHIPRLYEAIDDFLARVRARADPRTVLIVISDHGQSPTLLHAMDTQHRHGPPGVVLMAGGPIRRGSRLERAHVLDVFPTVLHLLGLPVPEDGEGRVLTEALEPAFLARAPVETVASYEGLAPGDTGSPVEESPQRNAEEIEKLRALGYVR